MTLPTASDNAFPSLLITEGAAPAAPAAGKQRLYVDSADHLLKWKDSSSTIKTAIANPMTAANDLIIGGTSGAPARLAAVASKTLVTDGSGVISWGTPAGGGGTPTILLDFALAADITNQALTAATFFDLFGNQNFTKAAAGSLIEVTIRGMGFCNDNVSNEYLTRANIDSGGTPVLKYLGGASNVFGSGIPRANPLAGGSVYISGLSAAVHTIKIQLAAMSANDHFYCRASTNGPTTGGEFLHVQVIEHL